MTTNNKRHIITKEILRMRQLFFSHVTFLASNEVSVIPHLLLLILIYQLDILHMKNFTWIITVRITRTRIPYIIIFTGTPIM